MPMTIRQIMSKAGSLRKKAAASVDILKTQVKKNKQGYPMVVCKTKTKVTAKGKDKPAGSANTYVTTIEVFPSQKVIVSCSCDDHKFTWEAALHDKGAARIEYSNGEPPNERNPENTPGCCKHAYAVGQMLIDKGKL